MGLIGKMRRARYVYGWRLRHWWYDTQSGRQAKVMGVCLLIVAGIVQVVRQTYQLLQPPPPHQPHKAIVWFVVWLIIAVVVAILAVALAPKPKQQTPSAQGTAPTTDDGQSVKHHFGTCRVDDTFLLAWKVVGTEPITTSSGGK